MLAHFFEQRWIARVKDSRALRVTDRGRDVFAKLDFLNGASPREARR
jgi:hypothetical protein